MISGVINGKQLAHALAQWGKQLMTVNCGTNKPDVPGSGSAEGRMIPRHGYFYITVLITAFCLPRITFNLLPTPRIPPGSSSIDAFLQVDYSNVLI
jgi:hypothetical protein